jgi:hypothetical protein
MQVVEMRLEASSSTDQLHTEIALEHRSLLLLVLVNQSEVLFPIPYVLQ